jgi:hypothetical protein
MSPFEILKNWNDRESIQLGIERSGYNVHRVYQEELNSLAVRSGYTDLIKYWNELAREWVACMGKVDSRRRLFYSNVGYRSEYLDKLGQERDSESISVMAALHPCERIFNETLEPSGMGFVLTADSETLKTSSEDSDLSIAVNRQSGIEDLRGYLHARLSMDGFKRSGAQSSIRLSNGLILTAGIEKSRALQIMQLLVFLKISMTGSTENLHFSDFSLLVPGFRYNAIVLSDGGVSYGLRAHAAIIGEIGRSFGRL